MQSHEVDYRIIGHDMQMVEVELDPGETVIAEAGAMTYMEQGIAFETRMGDGSDADQGVMGKLFSAGKRMITGESLFMTHFSNQGQAKQRVAFAAPYPGSVIPVNLTEVEGQLICQKDAFLCAARGTKVGIALNKRIGSGFFGGEGFILQKLEGDGMVFVHAGGTVVRKQLNNETLRLDTGCLVAFSQGIDYDIALSGGLKSMLFGGEGLVLATLSGTGTVWIQSLPFSRLADRILAHAPKAGGSSKGES
ncbi:TIGR00266 family protein [Aestuariirhabdus litorea]|uniref:TIGR00266 family protein n=1 Tax=Aestuariirhabdus litorea TaxID=2528527 RepID=A0A3P3VRF9_9GAMM|nr:TIGR00266 family protein [Aestuariirhabdus litorea]RRJ85220.1 TIGR00266 family protein [Aestuariirhabdus litorea]RWW98441.1 TIGR00266 family protein [Endozoicomonadaceae bacterium GTF-13]